MGKKKDGRNSQKKNTVRKTKQVESTEKSVREFPVLFPFWARLRISKNRTTLVIDEAPAYDKQKKKMVAGFVHREATSVYHKGFEEIKPNPDKEKVNPMYLKSPRKVPKHIVVPHNKKLDMPESLRKRYEKNNHKDDGDKKA